MILIGLMLILFVGGIAALLSERYSATWPRYVTLGALLLDLVLLMMLLLSPETGGADGMTASADQAGEWLVVFQADWIPQLGIQFLFAMDGLSLLMITLTVFLGLMALGAAWHEITERSGFFYLNLLWTLTGVIGVFSALDLFLFATTFLQDGLA